jgi:protein tyrosine/serine phosphatase
VWFDAGPGHKIFEYFGGRFMPIVGQKLEAAREYIPNLRSVSDNLARGGQPELEGLRLLKEAGIRLIVNLRSTESGLVSLFRRTGAAQTGRDPELEWEKKVVQELGMKFVQIPLDVFGRPEDEHFEEFLGLVTDPQHGPVFVHCLHGRDRTGLMMAVYRLVSEGWTAEKAYSEMLECGFDSDRTNLSDALFAFAKKRCPR